MRRVLGTKHAKCEARKAQVLGAFLIRIKQGGRQRLHMKNSNSYYMAVWLTPEPSTMRLASALFRSLQPRAIRRRSAARPLRSRGSPLYWAPRRHALHVPFSQLRYVSHSQPTTALLSSDQAHAARSSLSFLPIRHYADNRCLRQYVEGGACLRRVRPHSAPEHWLT